MVRPTYHGKKIQVVLTAGFSKGFDHCGRALGRRIRVQHLGVNRNLPLRRDRLTSTLYLLHHAVPPFEIGVTNVNTEANPTGDAVDGARENLADAHRRYRVDGSTGSRGVLDGEH